MKIALLILWLFGNAAAGQSARQVLLLCYPSGDPDKEAQCASAEKKLSGCGYSVTVMTESTLEELRKIPAHQFGSHLPVFVLAHGGLGKHGHEIGARRGPMQTETILSELAMILPQPAVWINACHSGRACRETRFCVGGSCQGHQMSAMRAENGYLEDSTRLIFDLMCSDGEFRAADANEDGRISPSELNAYLIRKTGAALTECERCVHPDDEEGWRKILAERTHVKEVRREEFQLYRRRRIRLTALLDGPLPSVSVDVSSHLSVQYNPEVGTFTLYRQPPTLAVPHAEWRRHPTSHFTGP